MLGLDRGDSDRVSDLGDSDRGASDRAVSSAAARKEILKGFAMTVIGWIQILLYCAIVVALVKPLGWYMTRVFNGERTFLSPVLRPLEIGLYRLGEVDETREQGWVN